MENTEKSSENSDKKSDIEEETISRNKRHSILKLPRSDDVNCVRSFRRVSFSSNFIKTFVTDEEKNTIWDNTIEENINTSSISLENENSSLKENEFNTTMLSDAMNVNEEDNDVSTGNVKFTENPSQSTHILKRTIGVSMSEELLIDKENIPLSINRMISTSEKVQGKIIQDISSDMKTGINLIKLVKPMNKWKRFKNNEATFKKSTESSEVFTDKSKNIEINEETDVDEMEITCQTGEISPNIVDDMKKNHQNFTFLSNETVNMDLTCQSIFKSVVEDMEIDSQRSYFGNLGDMEFTCTNPVLLRSNHDQSGKSLVKTLGVETSKLGDMKFTCTNPVLNRSNHDQRGRSMIRTPEVETSNLIDMEFSFTNPVSPRSNYDQREQSLIRTPELETTNLKDMEFTCTNPVLPWSKHDQREQSMIRTPEVETSNLRDMEFTCTNPVLPRSKHDQRGHSLIRTPELETTNLRDMEFTCTNLVLPRSKHDQRDQSLIRTPELETTNLKDMEFTCTNLVLPRSKHDQRDQSLIRTPELETTNLRDMEFTCTNLVLPRSKHDQRDQSLIRTPELETSNVGDMQFTYVNPALLQSNHGKSKQRVTKTSRVEPSNVGGMEFTCVNPVVLQSSHDQSKQRLTKTSRVEPSNVGDMEFTCVNPDVLQSSHDQSKQRLTKTSRVEPSNVGDKEFTCVNPVVLQSSHDQSKQRLTKKTSRVEPSNVGDMEFTRENPVVVQSSHDQNRQWLIGTPEVEPNNAGDNKSTCPSPVLQQSYHNLTRQRLTRPEAERSNAGNMEFTCANPVLPQPSNTECIEVIVNPIDPQLNEQNSQMLNETSVAELSNDSPRDFTYVKSVMSKSDHSHSKEFLIKTAGVEPKYDHSVRTSRSPVIKPNNGVNDYESNVKEYSTCADGTMQLINSASNIINARNSSACDNISFGDISKHQINVTYHVTSEEKPEKMDAAVAENDVDEKETVENKEPEDSFSNFCNESDTGNEILDQESSIVLLNDSSDSLPMDNETSKGNSHFEMNLAEEESGKALQQKEKPVYTRWNKAKFHSQVNEYLKEVMKKHAAAKLLPSPDNSKPNFHRIRLEEACCKFLEMHQLLTEKYRAFDEYRNKLLEEIQRSETSSQITENDSFMNEEVELGFPTIIEKIEEKAKMCDDCWKIIKLEHNMGHFTTFFEKLKLSVEYNAYNLVNNLSIESLLTDDSKPIAYFLQKEMLRSLSQDTICNSIGRHYNLLSLLDYIQMVMEKIKKYYKQIKDLEKDFQFTLTSSFIATSTILDLELLNKWVFTMDLSDLENITKTSISVRAPIGRVNEKYLQDLVLECPKGIDFLQNYFSKIQNYLLLLKNRKTLLRQKRIS
ncbi:hypothetical protein WA026_005951 [Henosepilachna vigintioctopunctata]|uniref:Uncharacterized protein n=1 Tax=Henosepilachna vigintioctopunctata TaxID=420089 RepID=A0AAW1U2L2_9CUCU